MGKNKDDQADRDDLTEKARILKAGPAGIMALAQKMTKDSPITKLDGKPGAVTCSTITSGLVISGAGVGQVATVLNSVHQLNPRKFTMKVLEGQIKDEKARAKDSGGATKSLVNEKQLKELNDKHFVVTEAGKTRVLSEVWDDQLERWRLERSSFEDIRNRYCHRTIVDGAKVKLLGHWWLSQPGRRQFDKIAFAPGADVAADTYNLWRGFTIEPVPGDWGLFRRHIWEVLCKKNKTNFKYTIRWMARTVQKPGVPGEVALALRGLKGTGKGIFAKEFGALFGQHYVAISNPIHLTGHFNAHLRDCVVLFCDEAFWAGDRPGQAQLQTTITEPYLPFEAKGVDMVMGPNHVHVIMASN